MASLNVLISGVSETMLVTLYCRAMETQSENPAIIDTKAVEITQLLDQALKESDNPMHRALVARKLPPLLPTTVSLRGRACDRYASRFLASNPDAAIVNLGCGLDARSLRADNGTALWFDLDLPEVIEMRTQFFDDTPRVSPISSSVLDFSWMDQVKASGRQAHMFIAEGLFMYLEEAEVRSLVLELMRTFPGSELVAEVSSAFAVNLLKTRWGKYKLERQLHFAPGVTFKFGVDGSGHFENWDSRIRFLDEWTYFDEDHPRIGWRRIFGRIPSVRYVQWTVHYRLG